MEGLQELLTGQKAEKGVERSEVSQSLVGVLVGVILREAFGIAEWLAEKKDEELFGRTEFELRDKLHNLGSRVLEAALEARKKGGT